jgi:hypothetical protein
MTSTRLLVVPALLAFSIASSGCGGDSHGSGGTSTAGGGTGGSSSGGGAGGASGGSGGVSNGGGGAGGGGAGGAMPIDLCAGLVSDHDAHPMSALDKPAVGQPVTEPQFGTTIRRVTAVAPGGDNPAIVPMYTTMSAWNADESLLLLFSVAAGEHQLYDGKTYAFVKALDINPADVEQVFWHTSDPDILFYTEGTNFIVYHVAAGKKEVRTTFDFCSDPVTNGSDPMFTSWDSGRIGLACGAQVFIYDIAANKVLGSKALNENPAQVAPSGTLAYLSDSGRVTGPDLEVQRTLDLAEPYGHASLGRLPNGHDTWNGAVYDPGPNGDPHIGSVVTFDLTDGKSHVVIGPDTGWPYPPTTHVSALDYLQPGWVFVSTIGDTSGKGLLDLEMVVADTASSAACRIGRHRSWGKDNTHLAEPYWAEPHTVPSPRGTRAVFASDWGNGSTVDTYVVELPSYKP